MTKMRLTAVLRRSGITDPATVILSGDVAIDGIVCRAANFQLNPRSRAVTVSGREIQMHDLMYIIVNKPAGVSSQLGEHPNIVEIMDVQGLSPGMRATLFPIGRLDKNSSGLMIVTNDQRIVQSLLNPDRKIVKSYSVAIYGQVSDSSIEKLTNGVDIKIENAQGMPEIYHTLPCKISIINRASEKTTLQFMITEGKKRQIRKMCESIGHEVIELHRFAIGSLSLDQFRGLSPGRGVVICKEKLPKSS